MGTLYLDTSALAKCYISEIGSAWMRRVSTPERGNTLHIVRIAGPEFVAALFRRVRTGEIQDAEASTALAAFQHDWDNKYLLSEVLTQVAMRAMLLAQRYPVRGYDAVQVGSALEVQALCVDLGLPDAVFVSADDAQRRVAAAEGLPTENPMTYAAPAEGGTPLLHITQRSAWDAAQHAGEYRAPSLDSEGFIHCSTPAQVLGPANMLYRGQSDLVLLVLDPAQLQASLRYEPVGSDLFPHLYGPLNLNAVTNVVPFPPQPDGTFVLPPTLR